MKKTILAILGLAMFFTVSLFALQTPVTKANYELAERFSPKKLNRMVFSQSVRTNWFPSGDKFWYEWKDTNGSRYFIVDPASKSKTEVFDMDRLAMELTEIIRDPFDAQHIPFRGLKLKDDKTFTFEIQSTLDEEKKEDDKKSRGGKKVFRFEYDIASKKLTDVSDTEKKERFPYWANLAPDTSIVIYGKGYNLFYTDMENLRKIMKDDKDSTIVEHQLTFDGTKDVPYGGDNYKGIEDRDTANRYPINLVWSPDAKHFIMEKYDLSNLQEMWVINSTSEPRPTLETYKYQMPG